MSTDYICCRLHLIPNKVREYSTLCPSSNLRDSLYLVYLRSTSSNRTFESAQSLMWGLFPPGRSSHDVVCYSILCDLAMINHECVVGGGHGHQHD